MTVIILFINNIINNICNDTTFSGNLRTSICFLNSCKVSNKERIGHDLCSQLFELSHIKAPLYFSLYEWGLKYRELTVQAPHPTIMTKEKI